MYVYIGSLFDRDRLDIFQDGLAAGAGASEPRLHGLHAAALGLHRAAHEAALGPAALERGGPPEAQGEGEERQTGQGAQRSGAFWA